MLKNKEIIRLKASWGQVKDDRFNFELIEGYFRKKDNSKEFQVLSDKTCNDLDFEELFMFLDRTSSNVGQQYLYNKLRTVPSGGGHIVSDEKIIDELTNDEALRLSTQKLLCKLKKGDSYYISALFQEEHLEPPKWFYVIRLLSFTSFLSLLMLPFNFRFIIILIFVVIVNLGFHYWNKKNLYQYIGSIPQLLTLNNIAKKLHKCKQFNVINPGLSDSIKVIDQVRNRMAFCSLENNVQGDFAVVYWGLLEIVKILFLLEPLMLFSILKRLNTKRREIEDVFSFVGHIDTLISIASLRKGLNTYCHPFVNKKENNILATNVYHPLVVDCVPNNISVTDKSILLTGSNMSGKTSFIRTIGINMITGLTINTCFAKSITIPKMGIYSAIRISDDLLNDRSYYFEEVLTIKEMIQEATNGKPNLFLLDEIFKGTNTVERISAGKAVLSSLSKNGNIVFVSTHDIELTDMLTDDYELYHFSEIIDNKNIDFDYKLKAGRLKNRNAIRILQINDYPDSVIKEAIEISERLDKKASIN